MSAAVTKELAEPLHQALQRGCPALLLTQGGDGFPASAFTWALAPDRTTVRFGADHGSATLTNLEREKRASLQVIAPGDLVFLIKGTVSVVKPRIEAAPFAIALLALGVTEVKDQSWPGVRVRPLSYEWAEEERERMLAMERAVYSEMRGWSG